VAEHAVRTAREVLLPVVALVTAVLAISTSAILIQAARADVPALAMATWRMVLAALASGSFALASPRARRELAAIDRRGWGMVALAAFFLASHFGLWVPSVTGTKIVSSVALVTTSPLWVAVLAPRWIGETVGWQLRAAVLVGFGGAITIMLGDAMSFGRSHLIADGLALGGALAVACYFMVARRLRQELSLRSFLAAVYAASALILLAAALTAGTPLGGWTARSWLLVGAFALFPQLIGHSTLNWALARLSATYVAAATLFEPVGSAVLAFWIFGQVPVPTAWAGGALVLLALGWATLAERPAVRRAAATSNVQAAAGMPTPEDDDAPLR